MLQASRSIMGRLPQGTLRKLTWSAVGLGVFVAAYLVGTAAAPFLAALIHLLTAIVKVFGRLVPGLN